MLIAMPKQPRRSKREIAEELRTLDTLHDRIPPQTTLGDDNQAAIDAQIEVLSERMSQEQVIEAFEEQADYVLSSALDALNWLEGDVDGACSDGWADMALAPSRSGMAVQAERAETGISLD